MSDAIQHTLIACDGCGNGYRARHLVTVRRPFEERWLCETCAAEYRAEHPDATVDGLTPPLAGQPSLPQAGEVRQ